MALRNHPRIPERTCRRVQQIAEELGYHPNARLAEAMARLRSETVVERVSELLWVLMQPKAVLDRDYHFADIARGLERGAERRGYGILTANLTDPDLSPRRLREILLTRQISGVIFCSYWGALCPDVYSFLWRRFSAVSVNPLQGVQIPYVEIDHYHSVWWSLERLRRSGRKRVLLLVTTGHDYHNAHQYTGAALAFGQRHPDISVEVAHHKGGRAVAPLRDRSPEVVLTTLHNESRALASYEFPPGVEILELHSRSEKGAGEQVDAGWLGIKAVDLAVARLLRREIGETDYAFRTAITGIFRD